MSSIQSALDEAARVKQDAKELESNNHLLLAQSFLTQAATEVDRLHAFLLRESQVGLRAPSIINFHAKCGPFAFDTFDILYLRYRK